MADPAFVSRSKSCSDVPLEIRGHYSEGYLRKGQEFVSRGLLCASLTSAELGAGTLAAGRRGAALRTLRVRETDVLFARSFSGA